MSPFASMTPLLFKLSVDMFCLSLSVHKLFNFFISFKCVLWEHILGVGQCKPLNACAHQQDSRKAHTDVKSRRLNHHASVCNVRSSRFVIPRKNFFLKETNTKVTESLYFTYA
jgi:hypothetical protein